MRGATILSIRGEGNISGIGIAALPGEVEQIHERDIVPQAATHILDNVGNVRMFSGDLLQIRHPQRIRVPVTTRCAVQCR